MPAAASFEDIYQTNSISSSSMSSLRSSASLPGSGIVGGPAAYSHLPDYMAMYHLDSPSDDRQQLKDKQQLALANDNNGKDQLKHHQHPFKNRTTKTYQQSGGRRGSYQQQQQQQQHHHHHLIELPQENYFDDCYYYGIDLDEMENMMTLQHNNSNHCSAAGYRRTRAATETSSSLRSHTHNLNNMITFTDDDDQLGLTCIQNLNSKESPFLATTMTPPTHQHYLTLEELKMAHSSCWQCGCNWQQDHVSLDCRECGGYALTRPCPKCDGKCKQVWERNIALTHDHQRASWKGQCLLLPPSSSSSQPQQPPISSSLTNTNTNTSSTTATTRVEGSIEPLVAAAKMQPQPKLSLASSCCSSQTSSAASSDCE